LHFFDNQWACPLAICVSSLEKYPLRSFPLGTGTQDFVHARQVVYHRATPWAPFLHLKLFLFLYLSFELSCFILFCLF
jgi:hypothetical protein